MQGCVLGYGDAVARLKAVEELRCNAAVIIQQRCPKQPNQSSKKRFLTALFICPSIFLIHEPLQHTLEARKKEAQKMKEKYSDRIPVIVEKAPGRCFSQPLLHNRFLLSFFKCTLCHPSNCIELPLPPLHSCSHTHTHTHTHTHALRLIFHLRPMTHT